MSDTIIYTRTPQISGECKTECFRSNIKFSTENFHLHSKVYQYLNTLWLSTLYETVYKNYWIIYNIPAGPVHMSAHEQSNAIKVI